MSNMNIENEHLNVNHHDEFDSISIDQNDSTFNYTIIPNALIRDKNISPCCRWLIIYLISNKPGWVIKSRQLWQHTKGFMGRDKTLKVLSEAIESGYIQKEVVLRSTSKGNLRGYRYTVSSTPKFKKCLRQPENQFPENQEPENQAPGNQGTKEVLSKELLKDNSLKVHPEPNAAKAAEMQSDFTPKVHEVAKSMIDALIREKPDYLPPKNQSAILMQVDFMLRLDKRDPQKVIDLFNWTLCDSFWADKLFKPNPAKYLREKFDQLEMKMMAKPVEKKTLSTFKSQIEKHFKNNDLYNGAQCFINAESVAFERGMKHKEVKFKEYGFLDQFDGLLRLFNIPNPLRN